MSEQLATGNLETLRDAIEAGVDTEVWTAHMHANPQGAVWRDSSGRVLHECGNCGADRGLNECENCGQKATVYGSLGMCNSGEQGIPYAIRDADDDAKATLTERAERYGVRLVNMSVIGEVSVSVTDVNKLLDLIEKR